jgi:hypothetical protein
MGKHARKTDEARAFEDLSQEESGYSKLTRQQALLAKTDVDAVAGERAELLTRRYGGQALSSREQDKLEALTARLKELLPPVSMRDLETLFELAQEAERVRERARERRQRLDLAHR